MNKNLNDVKDKSADEPIVIPDECGDTMWDAVLQQKARACDEKTVPESTNSLLYRIDAESRKHSGSDSTEVK
ncbi:MAG TPA: hypothetical protein VFN30_14840 [Chitinophagaceae bacterium]|nr:hypothetical protein [Chitinophagaceae bacterium]